MQNSTGTQRQRCGGEGTPCTRTRDVIRPPVVQRRHVLRDAVLSVPALSLAYQTVMEELAMSDGQGSMQARRIAFSEAIQGMTAGRIPGITGPDAEGRFTYTRPEGKAGSHGVGWSELPRYQFEVPSGWDEKPVSIADLGGTEIDLRFENIDEGSLQVVVAPVLRFMDVGYNASVNIEDINTPDKIIAGFAPELYGAPLQEDDVIETEVEQVDGLYYYRWSVKPHHLVSATAVGNRLIILSTTSNSRQWRRGKDNLKRIQNSFKVVV